MSEFDKAVKHVKTCLFWDFVDGQWLEKLYTPLDKDFFSRLMQGVVEAHEAESANLREQLEHERQNSRSRLERIDQLKAENTKLRERCASLYEFAMSEYPDGTELNFAHELRELGIEVNE